MAVAYRKERVDRGIKVRADDVYAASSYREMLYLALPRVLPVAALLLIPLVLGSYWQRVMTVACAIALLGLSWDFMASAGMMCLGQSFVFGVGAYISGALNYYFHLPPYLSIPVATLGGAGFCTLVFLPVLRLRGIYFAMVSFILPLMSMRIIEATKILEGTGGMSGLSPLPGKWFELYMSIVVMLICLFTFRRLIQTDFGVILRGIRDSDRAILSGGIDVYWYKVQALFVGCVVGAFVGAFLTHSYRFVGIPSFALDYSILPVASAVVGGIGSFAGAILGAFILVPLSESLRLLGTMRIAFYSLAMVIFVIAIPEGIFSYIERKYHQFERMVKVEAEG
jgi:branched-chain amino acid transport system permease protein